MRKKWLLTFIITILALPIFSSAVLAKEAVVYEDGEYEVPLIVKFGEEVYTQFSEKAMIKIEDGKQYIQFSHDQTNFILKVSVPKGEIDIISEDEENNTREFGFSYEGDLSEPVPFIIHMFYGMNHDMDAYLDMSEVPIVEETEEEADEPEEEPIEEPDQSEDENQPGEENKEPEEPVESEVIDLAKGFYTINGRYLHLTEEKDSVMANYLEESIFIESVNGKINITITVNDNDSVRLLKIDGENAKESIVDGNKRYDTFKLDSPTTEHNGYVEYQYGPYKGKEGFKIALDKDSVSKSDATAKPGYKVESNKQEKPEKTEKVEKPSKGSKGGKESKNNSKEKNNLIPDKAYEINFVIKHKTDNTASVANNFFNNKAILLEKDGERYIQITTENGGAEFIKSLKNKLSGKYQEMVIVSETDSGEITLQFRIDGDLSEEILIDMIIDVAGVYENRYHEARLVLDPESMKEVDANKYQLVASTNENGPNGDEPVTPGGEEDVIPGNDNNGNGNGLDPNTPPKPKLGDGDDDNAVGGNGSNGSGPNPKTGEETNILFYVLLLIGSAIPLAVKAKKHFA